MTLYLQELLPPKLVGLEYDLLDDVEVLHERTKYHRATFSSQLPSIMRFLVNPSYITRGASNFHNFINFARLELPPPFELDAFLKDVLQRRRSRQGLAGSLDLREVSTLLHHALRVNEVATSNVAPAAKIYRRPFPSPGALYPTEYYLLLNRVNDVAPCIAHYDPREHCLRILAEQDGEAFARIDIRTESNSPPVQAPVVLVTTMVPQRATAKYGARGYRMGLLEAGHAGQNICLVAEAIGIGSLVYGSYFDDELARIILADSVTEVVVGTILLGKSA